MGGDLGGSSFLSLLERLPAQASHPILNLHSLNLSLIPQPLVGSQEKEDALDLAVSEEGEDLRS